MKRTAYVNFPDRSEDYDLDIPDFCLVCGATMRPIIVSAGSTEKYDFNSLNFGVLLQCTNCYSYFSRHFSGYDDGINENIPLHMPLKPVIIPENIKELSPTFTETYTQSLHAEDFGLTSISGMGMRKALEFLIKDFCISQSPEDEKNIASETLGATISNRLSELPNIQALAKAASWIANDETHYQKKHPDVSSKDIKKFIEAVMPQISGILVSYEALKFINGD